MKSDVVVSVIVPVYNTEKYLRKCLDSLVSQTLQTIEIIIVNDGSTDSSQQIIDKYVKTYPEKIISLIKENGGLGDARNFGLSRANGKYIGFVDSDDWVSPRMYESMYEFAKKGYDLVMCDMIEVHDGNETGVVAKGFRGKKLTEQELVINSINPAVACNKIYEKSLFEKIKFSSGWYEDVGTTPVLLSYANSVGYLEKPFYYYRQRAGSITNSLDSRTTGVIKSWKRVLDNINSKYFSEGVFAVSKSIASFISFKPEHVDEFLEFVRDHYDVIYENSYYKEAVKVNEIVDIINLKVIPKRIHYFWFGRGKKSELIQRCIESWRKYAGDYEIIEWNESNCNIEENKYVKEAYEAKKWAFVADYFRIKVIYEQGGIYLDTDTELTRRIDSLRINNAFFAFETRDAVHAGIFGAVPRHNLIQQWLKSYDGEHFVNPDGGLSTSNTIVKRLTKILVQNYHITLNGKMQVLREGVTIFPTNMLTIDVYDGKNVAIHHYDASWWGVKDETSYKYIVLKDYFMGEQKNWENKKDSIRQLYRKLRMKSDTRDGIAANLLGLTLDVLMKIYKIVKK